MKLVELHTKADRLTGSYYLGYLVYQNEDLTVLIGLDDDANASGLILVNNQDLVGMVEQSPSLAYCQRLINEGKSTDPFQLMPVNQELLKGSLSNFFEGGNNDRKDIDLPGDQNELISRIAKANNNIFIFFLLYSLFVYFMQNKLKGYVLCFTHIQLSLKIILEVEVFFPLYFYPSFLLYFQYHLA